MMWKEIKEYPNRELYVYWNGVLIYKRWLDDGYGKVMDLYGSPF